MSREIKFRMWSPKANKFFYDVENVYECLMQQHVYDGTQPTRNTVAAFNHKADGFVWQQFTGLKDKNGKEIYENDLVKTLIRKHAEKNLTINHKVVYDSTLGGFVLIATSINETELPEFEDTYTYCPIHWADEIEVIGNIYETPNLLQ